jgi:hypothetical protein
MYICLIWPSIGVHGSRAACPNELCDGGISQHFIVSQPVLGAGHVYSYFYDFEKRAIFKVRPVHIREKNNLPRSFQSFW